MEGVPTQIDFSPSGEKPEPLGFTPDGEKSSRKKKKRSGGEAPVPRPFGEAVDSFAGSVMERSGLLRRLLGGEDGPKAGASKAEHTSKEEAAIPPLESLSLDETQYVVQHMIRTGRMAKQEETATGDAEVLAAEAAVAEFHARILDDDESLQTAFVATMQELGMDLPAETGDWPETSELTSPMAESRARAAGEDQAETLVLRHTTPTAAEHEHLTTAGTEADNEHSAPGARSVAGTASAAAGPRVFAARHDSVTGLPWPEVTRDRWDSSDVVGAALVGGMVSYLVGKRRGRIKAERRLLPIQRKLEKQVKSLRRELGQKETIIREAGAEQARRRLAEAPGRPAVSVTERSTRVPESRLSRPPATPERTPGKRAPEKQRLGKFLVSVAETPRAAASTGPERPARLAVKLTEASPSGERPAEYRNSLAKPPKTERTPSIPLDKHVESLRQQDLLELSGKIVIEGSSLQQMYESHQIGERALRRIVSEHLRGGDVRRALRNELVQHEIDFERDPILRDRAHDTASPEGGGKALDTLLQRADASLGPQQNEHLSTLQSRAEHQLRQQADRQRHQQLVTATLSTTIAVLVLVVIFLLVKG